MASLDQVKAFAGADPDTDDTALEMCMKAAIGWYRSSGITADHCSDPDDYDFWVSNLAAFFYDHRGGDAEIPAPIVHSVHQLRAVSV
jgi:hypothetical protein